MSDKEARDLAKCLERNSPKKPKQDKKHSNGGYDFEHPVFNAISLINGRINRLSISEMKRECKGLHLNCDGKRETVKRRLKEHYKAEKMVEAGMKPPNYDNPDYFVVIDFEATCEEKNPPDYKHEIIEFPAVLVKSSSPPEIVDHFHSYCRPVINTQLSDFCRTLTGIDQETVDKADPFPVVHEKYLKWLHEKHNLGVRGEGKTFSIVTDGPFDMGRFLYLQTRHIDFEFPEYGRTWINVRKAFANFYKGDFYSIQTNNTGHKLPGLKTMLDSLGMEFEGQPHSGLDDSKNIARVVIRMLTDGAVLRINEKIVLTQHANSQSGADHPRLRSVTCVFKPEAKKLMRAQKKLVGKVSVSEDS